MDQQDTMQGETAPESDAPAEQAGTDEQMSIFIPKAALEGDTYKPGDTITLKVKDVDPETGEVEATCDDNEETEPKGSMDDAFDAAMPADQGQ